jgi:hypothetical protein
MAKKKVNDPEGLGKTPRGEKMSNAEQHRRYIAKLEKMGEAGTRVRALELRLNFPGMAPKAPSKTTKPSGGGGVGRGGSRGEGSRGIGGGGGEGGILKKKVR